MHLGITTFDVILRTTLPAIAVTILASKSGFGVVYASLLVNYPRIFELTFSSYRLCLLQHTTSQRHPPAVFYP